MIHAAVV